MGLRDDYEKWRRSLDNTDEEEEKKEEEKRDRVRDSLSLREQFEYDRLKGNIGGTGEEKKAATAVDLTEPEPLTDRLGARGIQVDATTRHGLNAQAEREAKQQAALGQTAEEGTLAAAAARGLRGDASTWTGITASKQRAEDQAAREELTALYNEQRRNETVRNQEWLDALRDPEEIQAELEEAKKEESEAKRKHWLTVAANPFLSVLEKTGAIAKTDPGQNVMQERGRESRAAQERVTVLEDELAERRWADYERLRENPDFEKKSQYESTANGKETVYNPLTDDYDSVGFDDLEYEFVNGIEEAGEILSNQKRHVQEDVGVYGTVAPVPKEYEYTHLSEMSDDEKSMYNYIHATEGPEKAHEYLEYLRSDLYARQALREKNAEAEYAEEHPVRHAIESTGGSIAMSPYRGWAYLGQTMDFLTGEGIDPNAPYNRLNYLTQTDRDIVTREIEEKWGKPGSLAYTTGVSMAEFVLNSFLTGTRFLGGEEASAAFRLAEATSLAIMGTGAAADATISAKERGLEDWQAFTLGTIAGAAEAATELMSIEALFSNPWEKEALAGWLKNALYIGQNIGTEASEELNSEIINWTADLLIAQDKSQWISEIRRYKEEDHMSEVEAFRKALGNLLTGWGMSALGGGLSGGFMAGSNVAYRGIADVAQRSADRSANIEAARQARQAVENQREARGPKIELRQNQDAGGQIVLPTGEEAAAAETGSESGEGDVIRFGTEPESRTLTPTVEEAETNEAVDKAMAEGNVIRATGIRYGASEELISRAERYSRMTGQEAEFYSHEAENGVAENGFVTPDGKIHINVKGKNPMEMTFGHEITHTWEGTDAYRELVDLAKKNTLESGGDWGADAARTARLYEAHGDTVTDEMVDQELTADWVGTRLFNDERAVREIYRDHPSLAFRIRNGLANFIVRAAETGGVMTDYEEQKLRNTLKVFDKYARMFGEDRDRTPQEARESAQAGETAQAAVYPESTENVQEAGTPLVSEGGETPREAQLRSRPRRAGNQSAEGVAVQENAQTAEAILPEGGDETPAEYMARMDALYEAGEISDEEYDEAMALAEEAESTGRGFSSSTVERDEGPRGKLGEIADRMRGRYSLEENRDEAGDVGSGEGVPAARGENGEVLTEELRGGTMVRYSLTSWKDTDKDAVMKSLVDAGYSWDDADQYIKNVNSIAAIIAGDRGRLDYDAADNQVYMKPNADYVVTLDASTLCAKRLMYQGTFDKIVHILKNRVMTPEDLIDLANMMAEDGYQTPCGICYVEFRRRWLSKYADEWLQKYKGAYKPALEEVVTTDGLERLRREHPDTYQDFIDAMNAKGSANPKVVQLRTDYRGDINRLTDRQIEKIIQIGGVRIQSFSDFETPHLIDMMQAVLDLSAKKLPAQAYTKVPNFAWVFGDTGIKINLSLIGGLDGEGRLTFSSVEGMDIDEAMKLRDRYSYNVGTILVGQSKAHILAAMADPRIDYIIPFHKSGWSAEELAKMTSLLGFEDFTDYQNERVIIGKSRKTVKRKTEKGVQKWMDANQQKYTDVNVVQDEGGYTIEYTDGYESESFAKHKERTGEELDNFTPNGPEAYWDYDKSGRENAETYLRMCAEAGRLPKFYNFLVDNGDGSFSLQPDGSTDGYWKTLIDFKMYDNEGRGAPQREVRPEFNMEEAERVLSEYQGGANELPSASDEFIDKYVKHYEEVHGEGETRYSISAEEDAEYMAAVDAGDVETQNEMVRDAAERAGYDTGYLVWRGDAEPYNILKTGAELDEENDGEYSDDHGNLGNGLYFTPDRMYAERFAGRDGILRKFYLKSDMADLDNADTRAILEAIAADMEEEYGEAGRDELYEALMEETGTNGIRATGVGGFSGGAARDFLVRESWQAKLADPVTYDDEGNVIPLSERFNPGEEDIRYSVSEADGVRKVKPDMNDEERTEVLRNRTIHFIPAAAEMSEGLRNAVGADGWGTINTLRGNEKRALIKRIAEEFGVFKRYSDSDIDVEFDFSRNNYRESYNKQGGRFEQFGKLMSVLNDVIRNAVGIDVHLDEDYKVDDTLQNVYVMMGAFEDGDEIVPVKLAVKEFSDKQNTLYVTLTANGIKTAEVWKQGLRPEGVVQNSRSAEAEVSKLRSYQDSGVAYDSRPANISIAQLMSLVNPADTTLTKYFPEGMRTAEQQAALEESGEVQHSERYSLSAEEQTESEAFKNWFGDYVNDPENASKVVNPDGTPKRMYHGTNADQDFHIFNTYGANYGLYGAGSYFTDNPEVAQGYTKKGRGKNPRVYEVYLNIRNPIVMEQEADVDRWLDALPELVDYITVPGDSELAAETNRDFYRAMEEYLADQGLTKWEAAESAMDTLMAMGYDGINHVGGMNRDIQHDVWIAFDPTQIKSATDNIGTFDPENGDIRYSLAEEQGPIANLPSSRARDEAIRIEGRLAASMARIFGMNTNHTSNEFRQFRAEVVRPIIDAMIEGREDVDPDAIFAEHWGGSLTEGQTARDEFDDAMTQAWRSIQQLNTFADRQRQEEAQREQRNAAIDARIPQDTDGIIRLGENLKQARRERQRVLGRLLLTPEDMELVRAVAAGQISEAEAAARRPFNYQDILDAASVERNFREQDEAWGRYTRRLSERRIETADRLLEDADRWKDKGNGFAYARETAERNFRDVMGSDAAAMIDEYLRPVHRSEAESTRFKNEYIRRVKNLKLDQKARRGNAVSEAAAVQWLGEAEDNVRYLQTMRNPDAVRDGQNLSEWLSAIEQFRAENPNLDYNKVYLGIREFSKIYDELITQMNRVLVENGYLPVNVRRGYFPHFNGGDDGILAKFASLLGINIDTNALPTAINGLTSNFKPGKSWFGHAQERTGFRTDYDAVQGFDGYIGGVSDVIHQTANIRNLRTLATRIRYQFSDEGIKNRINEIMADESRTVEEREAAIRDLTDNGRYKNARLVNWLDEYTNLLANKKSKYDRGIEDLMGRRVYTWMKNIEGRVAANMIAGNLGSALTNFIPLNQAGAMLGDFSMLRGAFDTMVGRGRHDGFVQQSDFLTNRRGTDPLIQNRADRIAEYLSSPMNLIDNFTSEAIVRAAYGKYVRQGMDAESAMQAADEFAAGVMADRSKGALPTVFGSRNPLMKLFTQFQVEVNNEFSTIFKDIPKGVHIPDRDKKNMAAVAAWTLLRYFVGAYLFNDLYEKFVGRRAALDPIDILNDAVGDLSGRKLNNVFDMLSEGVIDEDKPKNPSDAITNFGTNALEEMPFVGGLLGGGRIPISSALPDAETIVKGLANENWSGAKKAQVVGRELGGSIGTYILPPFAGGAIKKGVQTAANTLAGGRYVKDAEGNDQLQYPYYTDTPLDTAGTAAKSLLFGPTATAGGREWVEGGFGNQSAKNTALYKRLTQDLGEDQRTSYAFISELAGLDPLGKRVAVAESGLSEEGKAEAMSAVVSESERYKFRAAYETGVSADAWAGFWRTLPRYDEDGNGSYKQAEVTAALDNARIPLSSGEGAAQGLFGGDTETRSLTRAEKAAIWSAYNPQWKTANNPFDASIGDRVVSRIGQIKDEEGE